MGKTSVLERKAENNMSEAIQQANEDIRPHIMKKVRQTDLNDGIPVETTDENMGEVEDHKSEHNNALAIEEEKEQDVIMADVSPKSIYPEKRMNLEDEFPDDVTISFKVNYDIFEEVDEDIVADEGEDDGEEEVESILFAPYKNRLVVQGTFNSTKISKRIPQYQGTDKLSAGLRNKLFVYVAKFNAFMLSSDFKSRLVGEVKSVYEEDQANPSRVVGYDSKGVKIGLVGWELPPPPRAGMRIRPDDQSRRWWDIAKGCSGTSGAYNVLARYWDQSVAGVKLYFTHAEEIPKDILSTCLKEVLESYTKFQPQTEIFGTHGEWEAGPPPNCELFGAHFCDYYRVYIPTTQKGLIRAADYPMIDQNGLQLAINAIQPRAGVVGDAAQRLKEQVNDHQWTTITQINAEKLRKIKNVKRNPSQKKAMLGKSATEIARIFGWYAGGFPAPIQAHRAEWLHRSAFSFGGLGGAEIHADKLSSSSQVPKNFIFGSVEANTLMLRPEMSIKRMMEHIDQDPTLTAGKAGFGWTSNGVTGFVATTIKPFNFDPVPGPGFKVSRFDSPPPGGHTWDPEDPPSNHEFDEDMRVLPIGPGPGAPMGKLRCAWLARSLEYSAFIRFKENGVNKDYAWKMSINPFTRAVPLKLEAVLDEKLEEALFEQLKGRVELPGSMKP
ncbi:hypothetical protein H0H81_008506 [Sphagnurus paluster]|uniref:Uncharacterized protein n=1 Tax=Sphagnurus paluster TaxID=117069 RepID=A0A9P7GQ70_9AGAR|nr:hypothetical protein H0H81_008506 [Sphagnurus paluster]